MAEVLETGDIYFLYRPRIEEEQPSALEDVQRLHIVLAPWDRERYRLLVIGRKRLPDVAERERLWGFVAEETDHPDELHDVVSGGEYATATRGRRWQPADRLAGEGSYLIARHTDHTHLAYRLDLPKRPREVQEELNLAPEASFIVAVKNPQAASPAGAGLPEHAKADFPPDLQERFAGRRFLPSDSEFLHYVGAEIVLIAATEDAESELDVDLDSAACRQELEEVLSDLRKRHGSRTTRPALHGTWQ